MHPSRRALLGASALAPLVAPALIRPGFGQAAQRPILTIAVVDLPTGLEPAQELSNVGTRVSYSIFDTLLRRDFLGAADGGGSELKPHLAVSWERQGPTQLTVRLRDGVRFHNGDLLTAEDVAFTFAEGRLWGEKVTIPEGRTLFGVLAKVEALDRLTVRFTTRVPDVLLEHRLSSWASWIVNKRSYEAQGMAGFARNPVGTGPYKFRSMDSNSHITLDSHDEYFLGRPTARQVIFREIPELAARVAGLVSGEFDLITNVPPDQQDTLGRYADIDVRNVVLANTHVLAYDANIAPLGDKRIRQALNAAIDRESINKALWGGQAVVPRGHNHEEFGAMYLADRPKPRFDQDFARAQLKAAGYKGEAITYTVNGNYYTNAVEAAQILTEQWKAVGINAELAVTESYDARGKYAIRAWSNSNRFPDPQGSIWPLWGPDNAQQRSGRWPAASADGFNAIGRELEGEMDLEKRRVLFGRLLDAWEDEAPGTVLYRPFETYGVKKNVRWRPYTFYFMDLRPDNLAFG